MACKRQKPLVSSYWDKFRLCKEFILFFSTDGLKYSVYRSNNQKNSRDLKVVKIEKCCTVTLNPSTKKNNKTKQSFHPLHSFLKTKTKSYSLFFTWHRLTGLLLRVVSCEKQKCNTLSLCSIYPERELSRSGNGIFKWGCLSFLRKLRAGRPPWNHRLGGGGATEVNASVLVWAQLWNSPSDRGAEEIWF